MTAAAAGPAHAALLDRRIINTRPVAQAAGLSRALTELGAVVVEIPMIEVAELPAGIARLAGYATGLSSFDWLVVTSPNGAAAARRALGAEALATIRRVAAVGQATAAALGVPVALIPTQSNGAGLIAEFPRGPGRVLVVHSAGAAATVGDGLAALGWQVTAVATHEPIAVSPTAAQRATAAGADAVVFASGSVARSWAASMGPATPPVVVAIGPQCAAVATECGLTVSATALRHDVVGIVATLSRVFDESSG